MSDHKPLRPAEPRWRGSAPKRAALRLKALSGHLQIRGRLFAALPISLDVVRDLHAFREAVHTRSFNSPNVDEHVLATLIGLDKAVALRLVEPLHSPSSHVEVASQVALNRLNEHGSATEYSENKSRSSAPYVRCLLDGHGRRITQLMMSRFITTAFANGRATGDKCGDREEH